MIKDYFGIDELVCRHVYEKHGERAWSFFDPRLLAVLLFIRERIDKPMTINNWNRGGGYSQRGYRCNRCDLVSAKTKANTLYCSAHMRGQAVDFDVRGLTAEDVRRWIDEHQAELPFKIRVEDGVSWVHLDVCNDTLNKVIKFKG